MRLLHDPSFLAAMLGRIYGCVLEPARWQPVLAEIADLLGARHATLSVASADGGVIRIARGRLDGATIARRMPANPLLPPRRGHAPDTALVASRDIGLDAWRETAFYREAMAPLGDLDMICFVLPQEAGAAGHWTIATPEDRPPITAEEVAGLELVAPHLRRAVAISTMLGRREKEAAGSRAALRQIDSPMLVLDGARRVTFANPRAEAALAAGDVVQLRDGRLRGATEATERLLRRVAEEQAGFEAMIADLRDGEERLLLAVGVDAAQGGLSERSVLVVLRAPREDTRSAIAMAARIFGLTPSQVQVLSSLAQGQTPEMIADGLGVSVTTVRTHLADLFRRTGTSRQAELVGRALSLASPLRLDQHAD